MPSATIWTTDLARAHCVDAGIPWAKGWVPRDLRMPFGGAKQSGIGREGDVHSLGFHTELCNVCVNL